MKSDGAARVLITGMSGTGKSTALAELGRRGHCTVDLDDPGWNADVLLPDGSGLERLWRADAVSALLAEQVTGWLFVAGCASNQGQFYDRFDAVALLSLPWDLVVRRIDSRVNNPFGKVPVERRRILDDLHAVEPLLRATATQEIDATQSIADVADALEALAHLCSGGPDERR